MIVNGVEFTVAQKGKAQAVQIQNILRWLSANAKPVLDRITDEHGNISVGNWLDIITVLGEVVTADSLILLFSAVLGSDTKFAEENFDLEVLVSGIEELWAHPTYRRVFERFFSTSSS